MKFDTKLIHGGKKHIFAGIDNVIEPIFLSAVYRYLPDEDENRDKPHVIPYKYGREDNPTVNYLERKVCALENGEDALAFSSGLAAINCVLSLYMTSKTLLIAPLDLYGSTVTLLRKYASLYGAKLVLTRPGTSNVLNVLETDLVKEHDIVVIFVETMSNPVLRIYDINRISEVCREISERAEKRCVVIVDNTIPTMYSVRPLEHGATVCVYSATKYLSGHNDCVGGFAVFSNKSDGERAWDIRRLSGTIMEPFTAYLVDRGLKTLHVRMRKHEENARAVAEFLQEHPKVSEVIFPGLASHPDFNIAHRLLRCVSGIVSFRVRGSLEETLRVCKKVKLIIPGVSFGGAESIITHPYTTTHRYLTPEEKNEAGISENLLRLSVGLEDPEDIIEDLDNALKEAIP